MYYIDKKFREVFMELFNIVVGIATIVSYLFILREYESGKSKTSFRVICKRGISHVKIVGDMYC